MPSLRTSALFSYSHDPHCRVLTINKQASARAVTAPTPQCFLVGGALPARIPAPAMDLARSGLILLLAGGAAVASTSRAQRAGSRSGYGDHYYSPSQRNARGYL